MMFGIGLQRSLIRSMPRYGLAPVARIRCLQHKANYKTDDSTVESDEIISSNNPWSPTLYADTVYVRRPGSWRSTALPSNYRLSYSALYESPGAKYVAMIKRLTLSFAVLGVYGAKLFYESPQFDDIYAYLTLASCSTPAIIAQYKTKDYVTRIFRLYNKDKPHTLANLTNDEQLIVEKLNITGGKTFNQLLQVSQNNSLQLTPQDDQQFWKSYSSWHETDPKSGSVRHYYVVDDIGGIKMDRIWGIIEHNSHVDNGRYMEDEISK